MSAVVVQMCAKATATAKNFQLIPWQLQMVCTTMSLHILVGGDQSKSFIVCYNLTICCPGDLWLQLIYTDLWENRGRTKRSAVQMEIFGTNSQIYLILYVNAVYASVYHLNEPLRKDMKLTVILKGFKCSVFTANVQKETICQIKV